MRLLFYSIAAICVAGLFGGVTSILLGGGPQVAFVLGFLAGVPASIVAISLAEKHAA